MSGEGTEDGADEDRSPKSREDGVGDEHDQAVDGAAGSRGSSTLGDPKERSDEITADEPANDQVEA
jgi:hypothetical protein